MKTEKTNTTFTCECCGEEFDTTESYNTADGKVCESCFNSKYVECFDCGDYIYYNDACDTINGTVCENCIDNYTYCEGCGEHIPNDYIEFVDDYVCYCDSCTDEQTFVCECCGNRFRNSENYGDDSINLCERCRDENYIRCDECECLINIRDDDYTSDEDGFYCSNCYSDTIQNYSYKPSPIFYGKGERYFGVELEISGGNAPRKDAKKIMSSIKDEAYAKSDSSIDDGFEIVTHPMTLDYHMNEMSWKETLDKATFLNYEDEQESCGLHIHVNRSSLGYSAYEQDEVIANILLLFELHWDKIVKVSRRTPEKLEKWCDRYGLDEGETAKELFDKARSCGRYHAVNLRNRHTIEFRLFAGTLQYDVLISALQFVNFVCDVAIEKSENEIANITWDELMSSIKEENTELIWFLNNNNI